MLDAVGEDGADRLVGIQSPFAVKIAGEIVSTNDERFVDFALLDLDTLETNEKVARLYNVGVSLATVHGDEEAAAEMFRETLSLVPDHIPASRALGRLYHRRGNWADLVALFESELTQGGEGQWRRMFQLAKLYETRLDDSYAALAFYRRVLAEKPCYLPALKGVARACVAVDDYTTYADVYLAAVPHAPSERQRLYLLCLLYTSPSPRD